ASFTLQLHQCRSNLYGRGKSVHWLKGRATYKVVGYSFVYLSVYITLHIVTKNIIAYSYDGGDHRLVSISRDVSFFYLYPSHFCYKQRLFWLSESSRLFTWPFAKSCHPFLRCTDKQIDPLQT